MTRRRNLTPAEHDLIASMREAGKSYAEIGRAVGCSANAISWQCLKLGAEPPKPTRLRPDYYRQVPVVMRSGRPVRAFTPADDTQLLELEAEGLSESEIGRRMGRRPNSIRGRLMTLARRDERAAS